MKTIKLVAGLFLPMLIMYNCANAPDPDVWEYQSIVFTFQDASGKDLVKEVVEPLLVYEDFRMSESFCSLRVIYPQPCMDIAESERERCGMDCVLDEYYTPRFWINLAEEQDIWEMFFKPETSDRCAKAKMLTLRAKSPIFGDDQEHEFVIHFKGLKVSRILMNDKECSFIQKTIENCYWHKRVLYKPEKAVFAYTSITL